MINLEDILVPEETISRFHGQAKSKAENVLSPTHIGWISSLYGHAFLNYLVLTHLENYLPAKWRNESLLFYNRYYWFRRFGKMYSAIHGKDSGLEQQAFQMLEQARSEIDWQVIEAIDNNLNDSALRITYAAGSGIPRKM